MVSCVRDFFYRLIPILSKLHRHCDRALNIYMWFGYNPLMKFCHYFMQFELSHFFGHFHSESELIVGTLCAQCLLQFYANSFKTLHVLWTWSEDMHVVWTFKVHLLLLSFYLVFESCHFSAIFSELARFPRTHTRHSGEMIE